MTSAHEIGQTVDCKAANCTEPAHQRHGKYAGLCLHHAALKRKTEETSRPAAAVEGLADKVKRLGVAGREVDRLRAEAKSLTERALTAKGRADEAQRQFHALANELLGNAGVGVKVGAGE